MTGLRHHKLTQPSKKKLAAVRSDINVTPLVDVCLVLLIIFMVVTPMLTRGKDVALPRTRHHEEHQDKSGQPIVSVALGEDGKTPLMYINNDPTPVADTGKLKAAVEKELLNKPGQKIFFKADARLSYGQIYPALIAIHEAGSPGIELGTNEIKEK